MVILTTNLGHKGGTYIYRTHQPKIQELCTGELSALNQYLQRMHTTCPNHYFGEGPRSSTLKMPLGKEVQQELYNHEVSLLANHGLQINFERFKDNHSRVQVFMLEHDKKTIAMEVPLWMHAQELERYEELFESTKELTGHIDILRIENGNVWVWDYKPQAHREKYATTQVWVYAKMLSQRTGIPFERFMCGYFDHNIAYTFNPNEVRIPQLKKLHTYEL